jgi:hypothetical protein
LVSLSASAEAERGYPSITESSLSVSRAPSTARVTRSPGGIHQAPHSAGAYHVQVVARLAVGEDDLGDRGE